MTKAGNGTGGKAWERQGGASQDQGFNPEAEAMRMLEALYPSMRQTTTASECTAIQKSGKFPQRHMGTTTEAETARKQYSKGFDRFPPPNVDNVDKGDALRRAAREWLETHPIRANAKTKARYRRVAGMMERMGEAPETATNANTFQGRKAATFLRIA